MDYVITATGDTEEMEMYHVTEYYRMRYAESQVMLLDFERDTNEIFDPENSILVTNGIRLGINSRDLTYKSDTDKNILHLHSRVPCGFMKRGRKS